MNRMYIIGAVALLAAASCSGRKHSAAEREVVEKDQVLDDVFAEEADTFYDQYLEHNPTSASNLGLHQYDGKLPDVSAAGIADEVAWLRKARETFEGLEGTTGTSEVERQVLLAFIRRELFGLELLEQHKTNPMFYGWSTSLLGYVDRDYAPVEERLAGIIGVSNALPQYIAHAEENLDEALPRTWIATALLMTRGAISFAQNDVEPAMKSLSEPHKKQLAAALKKYVDTMTGFAEFLEQRQAKATDDFALGAERYAAMMRETNGVDVPLAKLTAIGQADLDRNLAAMVAAAKQIDPAKTPAEVVAQVRLDRPAPDGVLSLATEQATQMRQELIDRKIVTIPTDDTAQVEPTPPFMRFNFAFMDSPGPFEKFPLPSFYYITPPDPSWPKKKQEDYIASRADLLFVTIHEVWPGHFLHGLHIKKNPSKILESFCSYATSEGWAHYTEEMMWDAGVGGGDPVLHVGQLQNALLRDVRFMSSIALHTAGMTVEESTKMFLDQGFQDQANAEQQAVRGTFDPGYLNYTLGKLMIRKLHDDWKKKVGDDYSLQAFHDRFLSYACAPIPVIRRAMLGPDAGPPL